MATEIEARRLNGTDIGKCISFREIIGVIESVTHGRATTGSGFRIGYVQISVSGEGYVFHPADKVTLAGKKES